MIFNAAPTDLTGKICLVTGATGGNDANAVAYRTALDTSSDMTAQPIGFDGDHVLR